MKAIGVITFNEKKANLFFKKLIKKHKDMNCIIIEYTNNHFNKILKVEDKKYIWIYTQSNMRGFRFNRVYVDKKIIINNKDIKNIIVNSIIDYKQNSIKYF